MEINLTSPSVPHFTILIKIIEILNVWGQIFILDTTISTP